MRIAFSILFSILIGALAVCAVYARRSHKAIGKAVSFIDLALIPPVIGNLVIIASGSKIISTIGCYIYFIGMDLAIFALMRFTYHYCFLKPRKIIEYIIRTILVIDVIQLLVNPFTHHAFDTEAVVVAGYDYYSLVPHLGQTFHRVVDYGIFALVLIVFIVKLIRSPRINSERYSIILFSMVLTGLWQTFYIFSRTPIDRSMIGFGVFGLLVFFFSLRYRPMRLLDRMLATIASEMPDALLFYDANDKCIWANRPAMDLAEVWEQDFEAVSEKLEKRFGKIDGNREEWSEQMTVGEGETKKSFVVERHSVRDEKGRVVGSFLRLRDNTVEQETLQHEIYNATHDGLTKVYNRSGYNLILDRLDVASTFALMIDVDDFKDVNDTYGHETGDKVLRRIAGVLRHTFRSDDLVCRIGGDEFVVLMINSDEEQKKLIGPRIDRINAELSNPEEGIPAVSVSAGIAYGGHASNAEELLDYADKALYETKRRGKNGFTFYANKA